MKTKIKPFIGKWSIVEMEKWDQDYVNMEVPGHFTINKDGTGEFQFGLVQGEMDPACGRGWAVIENGELRGRIFIHLGDDAEFLARRS